MHILIKWTTLVVFRFPTASTHQQTGTTVQEMYPSTVAQNYVTVLSAVVKVQHIKILDWRSKRRNVGMYRRQNTTESFQKSLVANWEESFSEFMSCTQLHHAPTHATQNRSVQSLHGSVKSLSGGLKPLSKPLWRRSRPNRRGVTHKQHADVSRGRWSNIQYVSVFILILWKVGLFFVLLVGLFMSTLKYKTCCEKQSIRLMI